VANTLSYVEHDHRPGRAWMTHGDDELCIGASESDARMLWLENEIKAIPFSEVACLVD
jgi:hypothetical protein